MVLSQPRSSRGQSGRGGRGDLPLAVPWESLQGLSVGWAFSPSCSWRGFYSGSRPACWPEGPSGTAPPPHPGGHCHCWGRRPRRSGLLRPPQWHPHPRACCTRAARPSCPARWSAAIWWRRCPRSRRPSSRTVAALPAWLPGGWKRGTGFRVGSGQGRAASPHTQGRKIPDSAYGRALALSRARGAWPGGQDRSKPGGAQAAWERHLPSIQGCCRLGFPMSPHPDTPPPLCLQRRPPSAAGLSLLVSAGLGRQQLVLILPVEERREGPPALGAGSLDLRAGQRGGKLPSAKLPPATRLPVRGAGTEHPWGSWQEPSASPWVHTAPCTLALQGYTALLYSLVRPPQRQGPGSWGERESCHLHSPSPPSHHLPAPWGSALAAGPRPSPAGGSWFL